MVSSAHAISSGLAKDGGLFVPRDFPPVALAEIDAMKGKPYGDRAVQILSRYLTDPASFPYESRPQDGRTKKERDSRCDKRRYGKSGYGRIQ